MLSTIVSNRPYNGSSTEVSINLKRLSEEIIFQAIEDLWSSIYRKESIEFFNGEGFSALAEIAGMSIGEKLKLLRMLKRAIQPSNEERHRIA